MSRTSSLDRHALADFHPGGKLAQRPRTPDEVCRYAAGLLESLAPRSSEADTAAKELRLLAKAILKAASADTTERRKQAETMFGGGR